MANYIAQDTDFTLVANAIRTKTGDSGLLEWPGEFKTAIDDIVDTDCIKTVGPAPVVSVTDAAPLDAEGLVVDIEPVQAGSGDPSPENVRPISGWTGAKVTRTRKNLFDYRYFPTQTKYGITITNNNDGTFTLDGESVAMVYFDLFSTQFSQSPLPYGTYTLSGMPEGAARDTFAMYIRPSYILDTGNGATFTNSVIGGSIIINSGQVLDNVVIRPQLELGSTVTDYEPYQGDTYDITFPSEAGTVYGGTLDVTSGVLTVTWSILNLGARNWSYIAPTASIPYGTFYNTVLEKANGQFNLLCEAYPVKAGFSNDGAIQGNSAASTVYITDSHFNGDASALMQSLSGVQLVYELATPVTYTLTPQQIALLRGNNTLWADTGDVTLKYFTTAFEDLAEEIGFADGGDY